MILDTDPCSGVSAPRHKHVDGGMERHTVHTTQMTMVVADHLQTNSLYYNDNLTWCVVDIKHLFWIQGQVDQVQSLF